MASKFVCGAVVSEMASIDNAGMARIARPKTGQARRPTFIKAWRKHRAGMSLAKLVERLENEVEYKISEGQLSRIERGDQAYSQDLLEAIAMVLACSPADLLMRDPTKPDPFASIWDQIPETDRPQAEKMLKALIPRTGTDG